jgi:hypothetical protein
MNDTIAIIALTMTIASVLLFATALIIAAWRDGSLKADLKWVRLYIRILLDQKYNRTTAN